MKKDEFIALYNSHRVSEMAGILGCSIPTIYARIKELGIDKKGKGGRRKKKLEIED